MQRITIGVGRTRDMTTVSVYVQQRGLGGRATDGSRHVGAISYPDPFELTPELARDLGDLVLATVKRHLRDRQLPF